MLTALRWTPAPCSTQALPEPKTALDAASEVNASPGRSRQASACPTNPVTAFNSGRERRPEVLRRLCPSQCPGSGYHPVQQWISILSPELRARAQRGSQRCCSCSSACSCCGSLRGSWRRCCSSCRRDSRGSSPWAVPEILHDLPAEPPSLGMLGEGDQRVRMSREVLLRPLARVQLLERVA